MSKPEVAVWRLPGDGVSCIQEWCQDTVTGGLPYLSPAWLGGVCEGLEQEIGIHAVIDNGKVQSMVALRRGGKWGIRLGQKPWATAYNAAVLPTGDRASQDAGLFRHLSSYYDSARGVFASPAVVSTVDCLHADRRVWPTLVLDVGDIAGCWSRLDRHARQRVRKARDLGVTVAESDDSASFERLYRLAYARQEIPVPLRAGSIAETVKAACRGQKIRLYLAWTTDGQPAAGLVVGWNSQCAYFMLAGSHPELRKTDAATLLWWTVIEHLSKHVSKVDMVGVGTSGIEKFKTSFNPRLVECSDVAYTSRFLGMLHKSSRRLQTVRRWVQSGCCGVHTNG